MKRLSWMLAASALFASPAACVSPDCTDTATCEGVDGSVDAGDGAGDDGSTGDSPSGPCSSPDCTNPQCTTRFTCVSRAPTGWSGPVALFGMWAAGHRAPSQPRCIGAYPNDSFEGSANSVFGAAHLRVHLRRRQGDLHEPQLHRLQRRPVHQPVRERRGACVHHRIRVRMQHRRRVGETHLVAPGHGQLVLRPGRQSNGACPHVGLGARGDRLRARADSDDRRLPGRRSVRRQHALGPAPVRVPECGPERLQRGAPELLGPTQVLQDRDGQAELWPMLEAADVRNSMDANCSVQSADWFGTANASCATGGNALATDGSCNMNLGGSQVISIETSVTGSGTCSATGSPSPTGSVMPDSSSAITACCNN